MPRLVPDRRPHRDAPARIDGLGAALVTAAIAVLDLGLIDSGRVSGAATAVRIAAGVVLLVAFVVVQQRSRVSLIPLSFFRNRDRAVANIVNIGYCSANLSMLFQAGRIVRARHDRRARPAA